MRFVSTRGAVPERLLSRRAARTGSRRTAASTCRRRSIRCRSTRCAAHRCPRSAWPSVRALVGDEIPPATLVAAARRGADFPMPLVRLDDRLMALELFHGPTFAFKDIGARVMARLMAHFNSRRSAADGAGGDLRRHWQRGGAGVLRRHRHARRRALSRGSGDAGTGGAVHHAGRQRHAPWRSRGHSTTASGWPRRPSPIGRCPTRRV